MSKKIILIVFMFFFGASNCFAQDNIKKISEKEILKKAENYFNNLKTLKAVFIQMSNSLDGNVNPNNIVGGKVYIKKPGKMRLEYEKNVPILIVADGNFLIYYDKKLKQVTHIRLDQTPAGIILKDNLNFSDEKIIVKKVLQKKGVFEISLAQKNDPMAGEITLIFTEVPFALKQWRIKDAHNVITTVSLMNVVKEISLPEKLFKFKNPNKINSLGYNPKSKR
jgi:outer membrane lipoprotein-sorting protein